MAAPRHRVDPEGRRLPIKLDTTSNGEFVPVPLSPANLEANARAQAAAEANAKRLGMGRRDFLLSTCGAASTLLVDVIRHRVRTHHDDPRVARPGIAAQRPQHFST